MLTDSQKDILTDSFNRSLGPTQAASGAGCSRSAARRFYAKLKLGWIGLQGQPAPKNDLTMGPIMDGDPGVTFIKDENPKTLEDLIRVCEIDTEAFEIVSFEVTKWEVGVGIEREIRTSTPLGINETEFVSKIKDGIESKPLFRIQVKLKPRTTGGMTPDALTKLLVKNMSAAVQPIIIPASFKKDARHLLEVDPFDVHFGKYCWGVETVSDFDLNIAGDLFKYAIEDLIDKTRSFDIERVLFPVGNDALHADGPRNQTFGGTPMDVDGRFAKVFARAHELHSWAIRRLLGIAPVDIIVISGNHDTTAAWHLGHVLQTEFRNDLHVTVENTTRPRKYYAYGKNLLGFAHGDKGKEADLPLLMAREVPALWAAAEHREWHIGHKHKYSEMKWRASESYAGTIVRTLNTVTAHDFWHTAEGYTDRRAMQAFLHHRNTGFVGMFHANVFHDGSIPAK